MSNFEKGEAIVCSELIFVGDVLITLGKGDNVKLWGTILTVFGTGYSIARFVDFVREKE